jgi:uncharacterized repeat protein (TIGR03803 family)
VFKLEGHKETVLYKFQGPPDGYWPTANLVRDGEGNLYGTTSLGGNTCGNCVDLGCGIVFKLDPTGKETILYAFTGQNDGGDGEGLVIDAKGNLYGTAAVPGSAFEIDTSGEFTLLHSFNVQGQGDPGNMIIDAQGDLFGPAAGMVFKITP